VGNPRLYSIPLPEEKNETVVKYITNYYDYTAFSTTVQSGEEL
jgi:hypothetical protein